MEFVVVVVVVVVVVEVSFSNFKVNIGHKQLLRSGKSPGRKCNVLGSTRDVRNWI